MAPYATEVGKLSLIRNAAAAPLTVKDRVVGSLVLLDKKKGKKNFTESDLDLLVALATQAATAIENARLFEAERMRRKEATLLVEAAKLVLARTLNFMGMTAPARM